MAKKIKDKLSEELSADLVKSESGSEVASTEAAEVESSEASESADASESAEASGSVEGESLDEVDGAVEDALDSVDGESAIPEDGEGDGEADDEELSFDDYDEGGEMRSIKPISELFGGWFLEYASYTILERAIPYINDGLKPVQRRILHAMKQLDDGRYNKVANIIGHTMQYHPHGDASIGDALVQLGQKELLIDCQGNWGNILTGDGAAAPRYIEARLSKFALDVVFNPKTTLWMASYDGRKAEPVTLPVKFPLLLAQGVEGIATGLATKILPHNFNELIDASIAYLRNKPFELYPDFLTGALMDVSRYSDGARGGRVRVRARIEKIDTKSLRITEIPYGTTTESLVESIQKANDKGKIKIKHIDDNTAATVEIVLTLAPGVSPDKTIDALYAFTDCELSISPNACVIDDGKPCFVTVSDILRRSTDDTVKLLKRELEIQLGELMEEWHFATLERIFIEERIYKDKEYEEGKSLESVIPHVRKRLKPFLSIFERSVTDDDIRKLFEIKMKRIIKFSSDEAEHNIKAMEEEMATIRDNIANIIPFTIDYYRRIKRMYGAGRERRTEIKSFENIEATRVVQTNEKLYINRLDGFIGTALKRDEYICDCSDIDDIIVFRKDGTYFVTKVAEKLSVGSDILHVAVFKKSDERTVYNVIYRDGPHGVSFAKRFFVSGVTRDKGYNLTKGTKGSKVLYFSANPNGEAEQVKIYFRVTGRLRKLFQSFDFASLAIKGRASVGNQVTKLDIHRITVTREGVSTLGGCKIWLDKDILRLNTDGRGEYLGEFHSKDRILAVNNNGTFYTTGFDLTTHYDEDYRLIEKFDPEKIWTAVFFDAGRGGYYLKRFKFEDSAKVLSFVGDESGKLVLLSSAKRPRIEIIFGGKNEKRAPEVVAAEEFIGEKSYRVKGKRLSSYIIKEVRELEPLVLPEDEEVEDEEIPESTEGSEGFEGADGFDGSDDGATSASAAKSSGRNSESGAGVGGSGAGREPNRGSASHGGATHAGDGATSVEDEDDPSQMALDFGD